VKKDGDNTENLQRGGWFGSNRVPISARYHDGFGGGHPLIDRQFIPENGGKEKLKPPKLFVKKKGRLMKEDWYDLDSTCFDTILQRGHAKKTLDKNFGTKLRKFTIMSIA